MNRNKPTPLRLAPRNCALRSCTGNISHLSKRARYCSGGACKQAAFRERTDPANQPSCSLTAPQILHVTHLPGDEFVVSFKGTQSVMVEAYSERQARTKARMKLSKRTLETT